MRLFDQMTFVDTDGRVYLYYSGMQTNGIWGVELDRNDLTRFLGSPVRLFTFDPSSTDWGLARLTDRKYT